MTTPKNMLLLLPMVGLALITILIPISTAHALPIDAALELPLLMRAKNATNSTASNSTSAAGNSTNSTATNTTTAAANPCFPAVATVQLLDGTRVRTVKMSDLRVGDRILSSTDPDNDNTNVYSQVFMFTHNQVDTINPFVRITTISGAQISLSHNHYIHASSSLKIAGNVSTRDTLYVHGKGHEKIVKVEKNVMQRGLFNPQTRHGDIYVNGIKASTYTQAVDACFAHALLAPLRAIFTQGISLGWNNAVADIAADKFGKGRSVIA